MMCENCRWLVKAGDIKLKSFLLEDSIQLFTKVLYDLHDKTKEDADRLFVETVLKYSKISTARHDTKKVLSLLNEGMRRAKRYGDETAVALLEMHVAKNEWLRSRFRKALKHFEQGWESAKKLNDNRLLRSARTFSTFFLYWQGRFQEAVRSYEKSVPDVERYPNGRYPLLASLLVGYCYGLIGQVSQGLGMLDTIRKHCLERGDRYLAAWGGFNMGAIMLDTGRLEEAMRYLELSIDEAHQARNEFISIEGKLMLAFAHYLNHDFGRAEAYLREFKRLSNQVNVTVQPYPYLLELCRAIEEGKLPKIPGCSLEDETRRMIKDGSIFMKGVAYRHKAYIERRASLQLGECVRSLKSSLRFLHESGHQIQTAETEMELARLYLPTNVEKAKKLIKTSKAISALGDQMLPEDIKSIMAQERQGQNLLKEILKLGQEAVTIRDNKELMQHIFSAVNRVTGAERGAIFLIDGTSRTPKFTLRASKNLTSDEIKAPSFESSMKMVREVASSGKGQILDSGNADHGGSLSGSFIRSKISVPMILRDKTVGVLYHDNRLLSSAFQKTDLELLAYFAAMAAFAMDNIEAYEKINKLNETLKQEKLYYEEQHLESILFEDIVGESSAIKNVLSQVGRVADTDTTVLILGETGVGKELVARAIHKASSRRDKPFIRVHCSALPDSLIPSELFGHEKGAFTGAISRRAGRFELANGGTLFLDEVGDLPEEIQVRLLRVLQTKEFERVGGTETLHSDFRLIAATNRDLEKKVQANSFRPDLYYRLNVFPVRVPPLRERKDDIPLLVDYFLSIYSTKLRKKVQKIEDSELERLIRYDWPGNIRELQNIIERGIILSANSRFEVPELSNDACLGYSPPVSTEQVHSLAESERKHIILALEKTGWKIRGSGGAAELLKIHPSTLAFRMKKLGIKRPVGVPKRRITPLLQTRAGLSSTCPRAGS